jgi:hypothetical protein
VDEKALAESLAALAEKLKVYDVILSKQRFLAGNVSVFRRSTIHRCKLSAQT